MIPRFLAAAVSIAASVLAGCGGGSDSLPPVSVYKSLGSVQCTGGGTTVSALQQQLAVAGVQALAASCGVDGLPRAAACGVSDGKIGIFNIPPQLLQQAVSLGFASLGDVPTAVKQACS